MKMLIVLALATCVPMAAQTVVNGVTTLVVSSQEPGAVLKAADDLARDMEAVFGRKPPRAEHTPQRGDAIVVAFRENLPQGIQKPQEEEGLLIEEQEAESC